MDNVTILRNEIDVDPLVEGYANMTNSQVADSMSVVNRTINKSFMSATEVFNAIDKAEFNALSASNKALVWDILHLGEINPFGLEAALFVDIFGAGSNTITALQASRKNFVSRGQELGLGFVGEGDVEDARNL